ncbi:DUF2894 domain-containing protein [Pelomonas sp. UHG3]|uniref:DUF2894 domain-containing protein n=1 Tax=Roseateles hydrophilus TaxID=2975054 RepID=A0ACC6C932_9BURK|nr:DUF2894 domain-containing protein [Pelomonas sp. UHG3]MCY4744937.1 DUF2894 domain-containing protein [Pelomonas sp. UHG3]
MDDALRDPLTWLQARTDLLAGDPVQRRVLDGLARRAAALPPGALRERLVDRLLQRAEAAPAGPPARAAAVPTPSPLTALLALLHSQAPGGGELRTVAAHQRTWRQLRTAQRMAEVSAPVPEHLGPLNSQVLVTRALQQLQALAPDYLQRLLTQLDTLAALAPLQPAADDKPTRGARAPARTAPAKAAARKPAARKR